MQTIVELPEFLKKSDKLLTDSERQSIINYLASHPVSGVLIQGTGGIRKLRWSAQGKGKGGGIRGLFARRSFGASQSLNCQPGGLIICSNV